MLVWSHGTSSLQLYRITYKSEQQIDTHLSVLMVDHDVVWLHVSVHDAHAVAVV